MFISTMADRYRLPWIIRCYSSLFHLFWQAFISYSCSPAGHTHSYVGPAELCYFLFNYNCIRLRFKTAMQLNCFALHYSLPSRSSKSFSASCTVVRSPVAIFHRVSLKALSISCNAHIKVMVNAAVLQQLKYGFKLQVNNSNPLFQTKPHPIFLPLSQSHPTVYYSHQFWNSW